jgi:hypothetical protein
VAQPERVALLSNNVASIADAKIREIRRVTEETEILAINASIEAARAGESGRGFRVVAQAVKDVSSRINHIAASLSTELKTAVVDLSALGTEIVRQVRGERLSDLAHHMIEIIDRNLYERSCDVRWWATDAAVVAALQTPSPETAAYAARRLGVILGSYTVYLDLWIADRDGNVISNGRPDRYRSVLGTNVADEAWFRDAMATRSGEDYAAQNIGRCSQLDGSEVAIYSTAVRAGGEANAPIVGVLGIFFDWRPQAMAVLRGVRLDQDERSRSRCLLVDAQHRVIAASDEVGVLSETVRIEIDGKPVGYYSDKRTGHQIGFALTPGYESYVGMGWYGLIVQQPAESSERN